MNTHETHFINKAFSLLFTLFLCGSGAAAQTSLLNIPTTDVMSDGQIYVEADFDTHPGSYQRGGYQAFGGMVVYGARKRMEIGLNAYFTKTGEGVSPLELQPNAKWQIYNNEEKGIAAAAGTIFYIPASRRAFRDAVGSVYATASKKMDGSYSPRFTVGGYALIGRKEMTGGRTGFLFGIEQPLHRKVSLIADWNSGKNRLGYSAAGLGFTLSKKSSLYAGYYFGNQGRGNNSLGIYYGYIF